MERPLATKPPELPGTHTLSPAKQAFLAEIDQLSYDDLVDRKLGIDADLLDVKDRLTTAKQIAWDRGSHLPAEQFRRLENTVRFYGWCSQRIQIAMTRAKRIGAARREEQRKDRYRAFAKAAERILDRETIERIWDEVK